MFDAVRARAVDDDELRAGTWGSAEKSQGSRRSVGSGRVMSGMTTATRSVARTISARGRGPQGLLDRVPKRGVLVVQSRHEARLEDRHAARDVDVEPGAAVLQMHSHEVMIADYGLQTTDDGRYVRARLKRAPALTAAPS